MLCSIVTPDWRAQGREGPPRPVGTWAQAGPGTRKRPRAQDTPTTPGSRQGCSLGVKPALGRSCSSPRGCPSGNNDAVTSRHASSRHSNFGAAGQRGRFIIVGLDQQPPPRPGRAQRPTAQPGQSPTPAPHPAQPRPSQRPASPSLPFRRGLVRAESKRAVQGEDARPARPHPSPPQPWPPFRGKGPGETVSAAPPPLNPEE